jgi:cytochrome c oxidase assembly protein subunit 15
VLHRFATFVAACTVLLVLAGSLVTSTNSGLAVPDWPTTYGWNMFAFPPSKWVGGILYEHGHRLIASTVGSLTIVLAAWLWTADPRRWMRWLGVTALGAVIVQGVLGGLTVLFFLPAPVSIAHAGFAEIFFCLTVAIALCTSPRWIAGFGDGSPYVTRKPVPAAALRPVPTATARPVPAGIDDGTLRRVATMTTAVIFIQILLGATMRHTGAGLAIPDFPLMFGHVVPDHWSANIAIHFAHRVGALLVTLAVLATSGHVWLHHRRRRELVRPATLILVLVVVQVALGALTVLSARDVWINSFHVVCGALVLTTSLVLTLRSWRVQFRSGEVRLQPDATGLVIGSVRPSTLQEPRSRSEPGRGATGSGRSAETRA